MSLRFAKVLVVGALVIGPLGCEPAPVVVNPDADEDTTVIEERDVDIVPDATTTPPADSGTDVNVDVGGGKGVDVEVGQEGAESSAPNP
jgi:hypothetical protein